MKIAILSGKGGAGKTLVAVNLAAVLNEGVYIDCDIEEPNGHLFLKPNIEEKIPVYSTLPSVDGKLCDGCRKCVDFCAFNALVYLKNQVMIFPGICHSCGGCAMVCPKHAITEVDHQVGVIEYGKHHDLDVYTGIMNVGEESGLKIIDKLKEFSDKSQKDVIIDCPPGSACSVMESINDVDFCILVAESTAFGFHNFCMVHELVKIMQKPCAVIINKYEDAYAPLEEYLEKENLKLLMRIPYEQKIAEMVSEAKILVEEDEVMHQKFASALNELRGCVE